MRKSLLILIFPLSIILFTSCRQVSVRGHGKEGTDLRNLTQFTSIEIDAPVDATIDIQAGAQNSIELSGYQNLINYIKTEIKGGVLHIYTTDDIYFSTNTNVQAHVITNSLNSISISGASDAIVHGNATGSEFNVEVSGAAKVVLDTVNVQKFSSDVSGVAKIDIKAGKAQTAEYEVSGDGNINAFNLQCDDVTADISGTGKVEVNAQQKLTTEISGAGAVRYKGHPSLNSQTSGAGSVSDAN
ncbi:MAG TPA: head GIN domain-containing protein [Flavipsychrobacter sp.]|nr:head GIN domain-containing protein [Flavipsychrobacter sp.]